MPYAVPALFGILLIETLLASRWWPPYYTLGLVLYRKAINWTRPIQSLPDAEALAEQFRGGFGPSMLFRELGAGEMAFRERLFEFKFLSYTPVMHGLLRLRPESGQVEVEGRANWYAISFCLLFLSFIWGFPEAWPMIVFLVVLVGGIAAVQAAQYAKVAAFVAEGASVGAVRLPAPDAK